jgi:carbonic anhydrase
MERLLEGVSKFQKEVFPQHRELFERLSTKQTPMALFVTCADSRVVPSLITQTDPGDLFICRNVGNMIPPYGEIQGGVSSTIEYAVSALGVKHVIVCGHTDCGAMKGVLHPENCESMPTVKQWLAMGEVARRVVLDTRSDLPEKELMHMLIQENVVAQLAHLRTHPSVASSLARGNLTVHGWVYHIVTGALEAWDAQRGRFVPIDQYRPESAASPVRLQTLAETFSELKAS